MFILLPYKLPPKKTTRELFNSAKFDWDHERVPREWVNNQTCFRMAGWVTSEQNPFVIFAYGMRFLTALWDQFLPPDRHAIKIHRTEYAIFVRGTCSRKITNGCWQRHLLIVGHLSITVSGLRLQRLCTKSGLIFKSSFCLPRVANLKACGSSRDRGHNHGLSVLALVVVEVVAFIVTLSLSSPLLPFQNYRLDLFMHATLYLWLHTFYNR